MALSMIVVATSVGALALASTGKLEGVGIEGFANKADVAALQQSNRNIEARLIAQDIDESRREQCRALERDDAEAKPGPLRRLNTLLADYQRVAGHPYRLPECGEI